MDISYGAWLPELEMEDPNDFMNQRQGTCPYSDLVDSFSSQSFQGYLNLVTTNQSIQAPTINGDLDKQESYTDTRTRTRTSSFAPICGSTSNTFTISFGDHKSPTEINQNHLYGECDLLGSIEFPKRVSSTKRNHRQAQEHVLAERKRREKLTQRFISLSVLLPEIKKIEKATVLEDACNYIKDLQNQVKELEETSVPGKNMNQKSTALTTRSKFHNGHEDVASSFDGTNYSPCSSTFHPGIKVRISGSNILVRMYCRRNSSLALKALIEMEGLHFTIKCNSVLLVSETASLITITAQMGAEFFMTAMDLVKCLQSSLSRFL